MNIEEIHNYCMDKREVTEGMPFGDSVVVYKVAGKVFLLVSLDETPLQFNAKCDPAKAIELREQYDCVHPGYHMNKKHWNTIKVDGSVSDKLLMAWIDHSYDMVVTGLSKKDRMKLQDAGQ
ncbi:MAG: MmcQ/YjbR family DNA-binding protein [Bacteroidetes bacterium]|nr:MmcQ/YjbR family DNA-binding protein [Bacteroidota bacterium]